MEKENLLQCRPNYADHWRTPLRRLAAALLFALPTIVTAQTQPAPRAPSAVEVRLYGRLMAMTDARTWNRSLVDSVFQSSWAPLRAAGALAIGQIGARHGRPGVTTLRVLLGDRDQVVASNAAYSLGLLQDSLSIPELARAVEGTPRVAREAAWALGEIGAP